MIVEPKVKGFICTTAHPAGCKESVRRQIAYCKEKGHGGRTEEGIGDWLFDRLWFGKPILQ